MNGFAIAPLKNKEGRVTATWEGGGTQTWPAPLSLRNQSVRRDGGKAAYKASRIEGLDVNPPGLFRRSGSRLKRSALIDL